MLHAIADRPGASGGAGTSAPPKREECAAAATVPAAFTLLPVKGLRRRPVPTERPAGRPFKKSLP